MKQPLLLPTNTTPRIYLLFPKSPVWKKPYSSRKVHFLNVIFLTVCFFEVTFVIVKKIFTLSNKHWPYNSLFMSKSPVWNRALLFQNSGFPTCINFLVFIVKKPLLFLTNTIRVIDFPFRKSPAFREIRLFLCVSTELFWVVRSFKKKILFLFLSNKHSSW